MIGQFNKVKSIFNNRNGFSQKLSFYREVNSEGKKEEKKGTIDVVNSDCLFISGLCVKEGKKVLLLNMANESFPCGFPHLIGGQEESICRRSSLAVDLDSKFYPLQKDEFIFTRDVEVAFDRFFNPITPFKIDVITIAAEKQLYGILDEYKDKSMNEKIKAIIQFSNGKYDCIILGAFGCGGYCNDPEKIANIFKEELSLCSVENIIFSILDFENHEKSNFNTFKRILT